MKLQLIVAGAFALLAGVIAWKIPGIVTFVFVLSAGLLGFFAAKNNSNIKDNFK